MNLQVAFIVAVTCLCAVGITALALGYDGSVLTTIVGAVTGAFGYLIGRKVTDGKEKEE